MSCYEWEAGTIVLPSAEVAPLKAALRDAANQHHAAVLDLCKRVWIDELKRTRSVKLYNERLYAWYDRTQNARYGSSIVTEDAFGVLSMIVNPYQPRGLTAKPPHQATVAEVAYYAPTYTNRDIVFRLGEASISFNGRQVTWSVEENNHSCERARRHPLAILFFQRLERINWTRGTGGVIVGNNEYNRESESVGGGGNYEVERFPKPRAVAPHYRAGSSGLYPIGGYFR